MDDVLEKGSTIPHEEANSQIETPDGKSIYVFRYDNPLVPNRAPDSEVSQGELVGKWFTDSLSGLKTYILQRPPGGNVVVAQIPKDRLEELRAANHPKAKQMDIEYDNFIVPDELLGNARTIPFSVTSDLPNKYRFQDRSRISDFVDGIIPQLQLDQVA